jgi:hypothetical protein
MIVNNDNTLVFSILDRFDKLPLTYKKDSVYSFEQDGSFYMVIFFASVQANRFILFTIVRFKTNFRELSEIMSYLLNLEVKDEQKEVIGAALSEIHSYIEKGGSAETMFFDAH